MVLVRLVFSGRGPYPPHPRPDAKELERRRRLFEKQSLQRGSAVDLPLIAGVQEVEISERRLRAELCGHVLVLSVERPRL